jgi:hypothetical protein
MSKFVKYCAVISTMFASDMRQARNRNKREPKIKSYQ